MSPVSTLIKSFRKSRKLSQKDALVLLGLEQSYLSALENGRIDFPKNGFKEKLIKQYDLSNNEVQQLNEAIKISKRHFLLPIDASEDAYEISNALFNQIDRLSNVQVSFIKLTLNMNNSLS